ncbi:glycosyltransferase [Brevundimonas kwangchunensis]|uniref:Glycosyltransferase n=1 Tax=Brevundimonas kwangchunensis TaxID=322163 RepID=A0ABN1GYM8_9CAUL
MRGLSSAQVAGLAVLAIGVNLDATLVGHLLSVAAAAVFTFIAFWRFLLVGLTLQPAAKPPEPERFPLYTIVAALHDEAEVVGQLVRRLAAIDYPADRLQGFLVLEADDAATIAAAEATRRPDWLAVLIAPAGEPRTKPRALNHALSQATGELLTVYDAEDAPDAGQLREAAARFASDRSGRLACLQAPLRIRARVSGTTSPFIDRQFAAEYAALFEVILPGLARLGLPFPLGGTSNHFRTGVLRQVGGWDAWNVTEDADLGFRLWCEGWRAGVITRPTWETPPGDFAHWLPQRTRWLKGYLQTWGVHTRRPWRLGWRGLFALAMTIGVTLLSAAIHAIATAWMTAAVLVAAMAGLWPQVPKFSVGVMLLGALSAWLVCAMGAKRSGLAYGPMQMMAAPAYWSLLSLAFAHAFWRLIREPFAWDKTSHRSDPLDEAAPDGLSAPHAAAPEPVS